MKFVPFCTDNGQTIWGIQEGNEIRIYDLNMMNINVDHCVSFCAEKKPDRISAGKCFKEGDAMNEGYL